MGEPSCTIWSGSNGEWKRSKPVTVTALNISFPENCDFKNSQGAEDNQTPNGQFVENIKAHNLSKFQPDPIINDGIMANSGQDHSITCFTLVFPLSRPE